MPESRIGNSILNPDLRIARVPLKALQPHGRSTDYTGGVMQFWVDLAAHDVASYDLPTTIVLLSNPAHVAADLAEYLQQRTQRLSAFEKHKLGHTAALNMAIKTAITNSRLMEVKKEALNEQFGFLGQAYRVLDCRPE